MAELVEVGWNVVDPDGNVVESGPITVLEIVIPEEEEL